MIAYAKQRPGQITYGSVQTGGTGHFGMELLEQATGIDMLHVPLRTPPRVIERLHTELVKIPSIPEIAPSRHRVWSQRTPPRASSTLTCARKPSAGAK